MENGDKTIVPTIGRVLHYVPNAGEPLNQRMPNQPMAAIVAFVHNEHLVNLTIFDHEGNPYGRTKVVLVQPGQEAPAGSAYCQWMAFQIGQGPASHEVIRRLEALESLMKEPNVEVKTLGTGEVAPPPKRPEHRGHKTK